MLSPSLIFALSAAFRSAVQKGAVLSHKPLIIFSTTVWSTSFSIITGLFTQDIRYVICSNTNDMPHDLLWLCLSWCVLSAEFIKVFSTTVKLKRVFISHVAKATITTFLEVDFFKAASENHHRAKSHTSNVQFEYLFSSISEVMYCILVKIGITTVLCLRLRRLLEAWQYSDNTICPCLGCEQDGAVTSPSQEWCPWLSVIRP